MDLTSLWLGDDGHWCEIKGRSDFEDEVRRSYGGREGSRSSTWDERKKTVYDRTQLAGCGAVKDSWLKFGLHEVVELKLGFDVYHWITSRVSSACHRHSTELSVVRVYTVLCILGCCRWRELNPLDKQVVKKGLMSKFTPTSYSRSGIGRSPQSHSTYTHRQVQYVH